MHGTAFFNDSLVEYKDLNLHISDIGIQRGYAIFDYFKVKDGKIRFGEDYFDRFYNSAELADLDVPLNREELARKMALIMIKVISSFSIMNMHRKILLCMRMAST